MTQLGLFQTSTGARSDVTRDAAPERVPLEPARPPGRMHSARLDRSPRLRRLLSFLRLRGAAGATTREIVTEAGVMAVSAAVDELRDNGFVVTCVHEGRTGSGANVYRYTLREEE